MLKQSYFYLILQLFNVFVGLFVALFIARNVDMETFAVFSIYSIVLALFTTFTFLGYENVLIRNVLHWKKHGQINKIKNLVSNAIVSRIVTSLLLQIPIFIYLFYLSATKFNNEYFMLLCSFNLAGIFSALSNANGLILKAFNRFVLSFSIITISSLLGRLIAIVVFLHFGFDGFILTLIIVPFLTFIISVYFIKEFFSFKHISYKYFWKFKRYKYFIFSGYLNYFKVSIDQLLVSIFLSAEILAVYNLAKKVEDIGRTVISSFFEASLQKLIFYKSDRTKSVQYKNKIYLIKYIFLAFIIFFVLIFDYFVGDIIKVLGLEHYKYLDSYLIIASWTPVLYLNYKIESHIISLFEEQKKIFAMDILISLFSVIVALLCLFYFPLEFIYLNRIIIATALIVYFAFYYKKRFNGRF
ncbi:oligosaccharide flippase family protein [Pseudoalteromonas sp. SWXJ133]|uniref:oligosaccharide flippase family protein n=1 Tax=Pseudoalteromonas sp. SWXJ133 TaxID=2792069 RepID=UPI0018CDE98D|nr:oligosaccharide flippase family protein [Pseudoalteromonas sp. SWXJ133]MBH0019499.1 oligosaccharide flippase family protein [Pseudoalteromonas sp. SWXJ133]